MSRLICFSVFFLFSQLLWATLYYVDPDNGDPSNPGTFNLPWRTLEDALGKEKAFLEGDAIILREGCHGEVFIRGKNPGFVTIKAFEKETAIVDRIRIRNAALWKIESITVCPEFSDSSGYGLIEIDKNATDITVKHCTLYSVPDASDWTAEDWVKKSCFGIVVNGTRNRLENNYLRNVDHGITVVGDQNHIERNVIENFSGDGIRALGNGCVFRRNVIRNCYNVDDNHDDGIQSWSVGDKGVGTGVVRDVVLDGNLIVNYTDPNQKHRGTLQGIGCFDGFYENWVITNNVILVDHWHGITLGGAKNCRILNNTVVDLNEKRPGPPWILIGDHKDGRKSTGNLIRNNLAKKFPSRSSVGIVDHNITITQYEDFFINYGDCDLRLKEGCPAVDAGSTEGIGEYDFLGHPRIHGKSVDAGAIEFAE
ncbi:MAG: right-handed parallel beta-helix repeat-containing protein [Sedimentisphaerales bacterium]|nr:right-handed parallel beta-helix repeat-containing protein [Sedimentisphaerales bacterium]